MSDDLRKSAMAHLGRVGIYGGHEVCRVIGYLEDHDDCYYRVIRSNGDIGNMSMVGGFEPIPLETMPYTAGIWDSERLGGQRREQDEYRRSRSQWPVWNK